MPKKQEPGHRPAPSPPIRVSIAKRDRVPWLQLACALVALGALVWVVWPIVEMAIAIGPGNFTGCCYVR